MKLKYTYKLWLTFASTLALAGFATSAAPADTPELKLAMFMAPTIVVAGMQDGDFAKLGDKFVAVDSGPEALPLVKRGELSGIIDISAPPIIAAITKGIKLKIVWATSSTEMALMSSPAISSAKDLEGKKIAIITGSALQYHLETYLAQNGMSAADVKEVELPPPSMAAALKTGQIDAAFAWDPFISQMTKDGAHKLSGVPDQGFIVFSSDVVEHNPAGVQAFICAFAGETAKFLKTPAVGYASVDASIGLPADQIAVLLPVSSISPTQQDAAAWLGAKGEPSKLASELYTVGEWMSKQGLVASEPTMEDVRNVFDYDFAAAVSAGKCGS